MVGYKVGFSLFIADAVSRQWHVNFLWLLIFLKKKYTHTQINLVCKVCGYKDMYFLCYNIHKCGNMEVLRTKNKNTFKTLHLYVWFALLSNLVCKFYVRCYRVLKALSIIDGTRMFEKYSSTEFFLPINFVHLFIKFLAQNHEFLIVRYKLLFRRVWNLDELYQNYIGCCIEWVDGAVTVYFWKIAFET